MRLLVEIFCFISWNPHRQSETGVEVGLLGLGPAGPSFPCLSSKGGEVESSVWYKFCFINNLTGDKVYHKVLIITPSKGKAGPVRARVQQGTVILPQVADSLTWCLERKKFIILSSLLFYPKREYFWMCGIFLSSHREPAIWRGALQRGSLASPSLGCNACRCFELQADGSHCPAVTAHPPYQNLSLSPDPSFWSAE